MGFHKTAAGKSGDEKLARRARKRHFFSVNQAPLLPRVIENLAESLAAAQGGRLTANHLLPHLPVSLEIADETLQAMVDGQVVQSEEREGLRWYVFPELLEAPARPIEPGLCAFSQVDFDPAPGELLAPAVMRQVEKELSERAEKEGWPAAAVWQHELLFITARANHPLPIAEIAGQSRFSFAQVKGFLEQLAKQHAAEQVLDEANGQYQFRFPSLDYPVEAFQRNDRFIRRHPAALKEALEMRLVRFLSAMIALGVISLAGALAFRIPVPLVLLIAAIVSVVLAIRILSGKREVAPEQLM